MKQNIKDRLKQFVAHLKESEQQLQVQMNTTFIGVAQKRIFNNQKGSQNAQGESLGVYSPAYKKQKEKKYGSALSQKVNLYASGTLYGAMKQVKDSNGVHVAITDVNYKKGQTTVEVSKYLDKQYGEIFAPQESEIETVIKSATVFISKTTNEFFNQ